MAWDAKAKAGIIPAYAGSTRPDDRRRARTSDHPRIRGEHGGLLSRPAFPHGSSPHTRGAPARHPLAASDARIIPAYAGSTTSTASIPRWQPDHPRIRGEHAVERTCVLIPLGSSPHTRGALRRLRVSDDLLRDHPRIRGEHLWGLRQMRVTRGSSPHTRGARGVEVRPPTRWRIIPAYAGSTPALAFWLMHKLGSSPHTRGALALDLSGT